MGGAAPNCANGITENFETDYDVRQPDNTLQDPTDNPQQTGCGPQGAPWKIPGEVPADNTGTLTKTASTEGGNNSLPTGAFFEKYRVLCKIDNPLVGDYLVHVTAPTGQGTNDFSILAFHSLGSPMANVFDFTISTAEKLPLTTVKAAGSADFYVARITPAARTRTLSLELFDFGDSPVPGGLSSGTFNLFLHRAHIPSTGDALSCTYTKPPDDPWAPGPLWGDPNNETPAGAGCSIQFDTYNWNGQWVTVHVTIPGNAAGDGYQCATGPGSTTDDCWIMMHIQPDPGQFLRDATTWNAHLAGAPDRLVK